MKSNLLFNVYNFCKETVALLPMPCVFSVDYNLEYILLRLFKILDLSRNGILYIACRYDYQLPYDLDSQGFLLLPSNPILNVIFSEFDVILTVHRR